MNKYEILQNIGQGEYGVVIKAKNRQNGELVAIKKFKQDDSDQQNKRVILREVKILKTLNHQNIIELKQAFRKKGKIYLVCQYVDKNLLQILEEGSININQLKNYSQQLLKGIQYMHSLNIIHRDIKPQNVLIGKNQKVKICDLGFARTLPNNGKMTDYVATRWYRPPQLLLGRDDYDQSIDIWSIGCVMAQMIDGQPLFGGQNDLDQLYLIQKCLGPLTSQHQQYFLKNPKFLGMKFPDINTLQTIDRRYFGKIDKLGLDLLKKMLKMDPRSRITAQQALNHPFFQRSGSHSQIQFRRNHNKQQISQDQLPQHQPKPHIPINNFMHEGLTTRHKQQKIGVNKVTGLGKLKKNQQNLPEINSQQYQIPILNTKGKSLGNKKGGAASIRQKTVQKYSKNILKTGKNEEQIIKKQKIQYQKQEEDQYDQSWQKQQPETNVFVYDKKPNIGANNAYNNGQINMTPSLFQNLSHINKSKSKQKGHFFIKETDSPTKQEARHQKAKKNIRNIKKDNISIVFNNNTYNLNLLENP